MAAPTVRLATLDPTIKKLLADIYGSTTAGTLQARSDPNTLDFNYTADAKQLRQYPTWRFDYNLYDEPPALVRELLPEIRRAFPTR